ncbi:MAG: hypothetical protein M3315_06850 [Actinomycetota bacterium]|nr:hypothetical protein [Actinomycetota bacterium]
MLVDRDAMLDAMVLSAQEAAAMGLSEEGQELLEMLTDAGKEIGLVEAAKNSKSYLSLRGDDKVYMDSYLSKLALINDFREYGAG